MWYRLHRAAYSIGILALVVLTGAVVLNATAVILGAALISFGAFTLSWWLTGRGFGRGA